MKTKILVFCLLYGVLHQGFISQAQALDTDLYKESLIAADPKILLLLDTSGSMRCSGDRNKPEFDGEDCARMMIPGGKSIITGSGTVDSGLFRTATPPARMQSIQNILLDFIDKNSADAWPDNYQVGLSVFSYPGSAVISPVKPLGMAATNEIGINQITENGQARPLTGRDILKREITAVSGSGLTPTLGAIFEAALYMSSQAVVTAASRTFAADADFLAEKNFPGNAVANWTRQQNHRIAHPDSFTGGSIIPARYNRATPSACQQAMLRYGPEYGRFTDACANEVIQATGDLRYRGPEDSPLACSNGDKHIIVITDGFPQSSSGSAIVRNNEPLAVWMNRFLNDNANAVGDDPRCPYGAAADNADAWACMRSIVEKLKKEHNTTTHVISFLADKSTANNLSDNNKQLKSLADSSEGHFYLAQNPEEIKLAIQEIAVSAAKSASFATPSVGIDNFNPFSHQDAVTYSLFKPSSNRFWYGNIKRYETKMVDNKMTIVDKNGKPALNAQTGEFNTNITSFWSSTQDGNNILLGGAAANLRTGNKTPIFTDFAKGSDQCKTPLNTGANLRLVSNCETAVKEYLFTRAMIGRNPSDQDDRDDATKLSTHWYKWLTGIDHESHEWNFMQKTTPKEDLPPEPEKVGEFDRVRKWMGAPLHTSPFIVNYKTNRSNTTNTSSDTVFISSNDGFLYGFDSQSGKEVFRFFPEPLLDRIKAITNYATGRVIFGLDGQWTLWREDKYDNTGTRNGTISVSEGDKVAIFGGMRRGGDYYYGLDITDIKNPKQIFRLHGGSNGKTPTESAFSRLGQTWSKPELINVTINGQPEVLLVFGGGYDVRYDPPKEGEATVINPGATANTLGNAIYFVYAEGTKAGKIAAWVSADASTAPGKTHADMRFAIPARISVLDLNLDGFVDHIYAADLAGQVFRLDINKRAASPNDLIARTTTLGKFGVTGKDGQAIQNNRRFYEGPSVALIEDSLVSKRYIAVALASGWRENPFNRDADNFAYVLRDEEPLTLLAGSGITDSPYPISHADMNKRMFDVTQITNNDIDTAQNQTSKLPKAIALAMPLDQAGEKSFGIPLIANNAVYFSTLIPADLNDTATINPQTCSRDTGDSRVYGINLLTGKGVLPKAKPGTTQVEDSRFVEFTTPFTAGDISVQINEQGIVSISSGLTPVTQLSLPDNITEKMHWRQMNTGSQVDRSDYYE